jgi:large subunit ribosomal protein L5
MAKEKETKKKQQAAEKSEKKTAGKKESAGKSEPQEKITPRLLERWRKEIVPALMKRFGYKNVMQVPRLEKISVNVGVGDAVQDPKILDGIVNELSIITGQRPEIDIEFQAAGGYAYRRAGHSPAGIHVRVPRSVHQYRRPAYTRLPRRKRPLFRRKG